MFTALGSSSGSSDQRYISLYTLLYLECQVLFRLKFIITVLRDGPGILFLEVGGGGGYEKLSSANFFFMRLCEHFF